MNSKPRRVIRFSDDRVIAVNIFGESITELSGPYEEKRELINSRADEKTVFQRQGEPGMMDFTDETKESW